MRIALGVEYDGSSYNGWQSQPDVPNVQDALQLALSGIAGASIAILAAGRTDTGVHALEQVVHFDTNVDRPLTAWMRGTMASRRMREARASGMRPSSNSVSTNTIVDAGGGQPGT